MAIRRGRREGPSATASPNKDGFVSDGWSGFYARRTYSLLGCSWSNRRIGCQRNWVSTEKGGRKPHKREKHTERGFGELPTNTKWEANGTKLSTWEVMLVLYLTTPMYRCRLTLVSRARYILLSHDVHLQIDALRGAGEDRNCVILDP